MGRRRTAEGSRATDVKCVGKRQRRNIVSKKDTCHFIPELNIMYPHVSFLLRLSDSVSVVVVSIPWVVG